MLRLRAIGTSLIEIGDSRITPESGVLFALLLYLIINAGRPTPRSELVRLLWPETDSRNGGHRLRQALYQLRKLGTPIVTDGDTLLLKQAAVARDCDHPCAEWPRESESPCSRSCLEFLPNYVPTLSVAFAEWLESERERVRSSLRHEIAALLAEARASGDQRRVAYLAQLCLDIDPLNRDAIFALAQAYAQLGRRADAIAVLDELCGDSLSQPNEFRVQLRALRRRILAVERATVRENAPTQLAGREDLLEQVSWWANGSQEWTPRVLSLSGEAGIGKTRLLNEGVRRAMLQGARCLMYTPSANGADRPLAGIVDLLSSLLSLPGSVGCAPESYSLVSSLARGDHADTIPRDTTDSAFRYATLRRSVLDLTMRIAWIARVSKYCSMVLARIPAAWGC